MEAVNVTESVSVLLLAAEGPVIAPIFLLAVNIHEYVIPKSEVDYYNGSEVYLNIPHDMLSIFEVKSS